MGVGRSGPVPGGTPAHTSFLNLREDFFTRASRCRIAAPVPTITVLLGDMPQTLRAILEHALSEHGDIRVIHESAAPPAGAVNAGPEVLIVGGAHADDPAALLALLSRRPRTRVLTVTASGRRCVLHELLPHRTELGELSPEQLAAAVRAAAPRPPFVVSS
jgi:DNA-binding NarL/FixJ family response regulator